MSLDKLVDSAQLDADLTSVADAIRAKSGGSSALAFPAGFVSEIQAIPSGGGGNYDPYGLPSGYTALKYLRSTGTQWIKTDIAPTLETKIQATGQRTVTSGYTALMGSTNPLTYIPMASGAYGGTYYAKFGNSGEKSMTTAFPVGTALPPTITVDKTQAVFSTEGYADKSVSIGATGMGTINPNTKIALFGRYDGSSDICSPTSGFLLRAKIWDDGTLVADFVPAKRDADDALGMYDLVNDTFYTNAGSGTFVGGEF